MKKHGAQISFKIKTWGGRRKGAGRPNMSGSVNHMRREHFNKNQPLHINYRLQRGLSGLRQKAVHELFKMAAEKMTDFGVHLNHYSLQGNHLHLIVEAKDAHSLERGMRSFAVRFAKGVKKRLKIKSARIFNGRYHLTVLKNPTQTRNALRYVLLNYSKHSKLIEHIDSYSSGFYFSQWRTLVPHKTRQSDLLTRQEKTVHANLPKYLRPPATWLLREGWRTGIGAGTGIDTGTEA